MFGKSKLPEIMIKLWTNTNMDAFYSLVKKVNTVDRHLFSLSNFQADRSTMHTQENVDTQDTPLLSLSSYKANAINSNDDDKNYIIHHDTSILDIPVLSNGCSVQYNQDDHVEVVISFGIDISNPADPSLFEIRFPDSRRVQTTREHVELGETPNDFSIPNQYKKY